MNSTETRKVHPLLPLLEPPFRFVVRIVRRHLALCDVTKDINTPSQVRPPRCLLCFFFLEVQIVDVDRLRSFYWKMRIKMGKWVKDGTFKCQFFMLHLCRTRGKHGVGVAQPQLQWKLVWPLVDYTIRIHLFLFPGCLRSSHWCTRPSRLLAVSYSLQVREHPPHLNYFSFTTLFPTPQTVSPPSTVSSTKSICARGGTL